jgi:hypothetical protein
MLEESCPIIFALSTFHISEELNLATISNHAQIETQIFSHNLLFMIFVCSALPKLMVKS